MRRDLWVLADRPFDMIVIGAGIHGAAIARRGAQHGLSVALIDRGDFGGGTSANSLKVLHGGLRHLQHGDFLGLRASIVARRRWFRMAPHLVSPCGFVTPSYGHGRHSSMVFRAALAINDLVGVDRNRGVCASSRIEAGRIISREQLLRIAPGLRRRPLTGGAVWFDGLVWNTERMTLAFVLSAAADGACVVNYVRATEYRIAKGRVIGIFAADTISGEKFVVQGRTVINATGPWRDELRFPTASVENDSGDFGWAKAVNVVVGKGVFQDYAVGLPAGFAVGSERAIGERPDRFYFFIPWRGKTMIGTTYRWVGSDKSRGSVTVSEVEDIVRVANSVYPEAEISMEDVIFTHAGLLPAVRRARGQAEDIRLLRHDRIQAAPRGLITVSSVKYTGAISTADCVVKSVMKEIGWDGRRLRGDGVIWGGEPMAEDVPCVQELSAPLRRDQREHLRRTYGSKYHLVLEYLGADASGALPLSEGSPHICAEVLHAIRREMALRLEDVIFRRIDLGTHGYPGRDAIESCAAIMARELGWSMHRCREEVERVEKGFRSRCMAIRPGADQHDP